MQSISGSLRESRLSYNPDRTHSVSVVIVGNWSVSFFGAQTRNHGKQTTSANKKRTNSENGHLALLIFKEKNKFGTSLMNECFLASFFLHIKNTRCLNQWLVWQCLSNKNEISPIPLLSCFSLEYQEYCTRCPLLEFVLFWIEVYLSTWIQFELQFIHVNKYNSIPYGFNRDGMRSIRIVTQYEFKKTTCYKQKRQDTTKYGNLLHADLQLWKKPSWKQNVG